MHSGHAFFAAGRAGDIEAALALLRSWGIETSGNPDLYIRSFGAFGIDDARAISERVAMKAIGTRRVFLLSLDSITQEAQNALLKTLEEPQGGALFLVLHPNPQTLLATVRSRVQIIDLPHSGRPRSGIDAAAFVKAHPAKRLDLLKPLLEKGEDDKRDMGEILSFLFAIETELGSGAINPQALHALYRARKYSADRGALLKPLLEQVALLI